MHHCCPYISVNEPPILIMNIENHPVLLPESSNEESMNVKIKVKSGVTFIVTDKDSNVKDRTELIALGNQYCSLWNILG